MVRALLDQGSEATFITESLTQTLRSKRIRMPVSISAVGGIQAGMVRHAAAISISSISDDQSFSTTALIINTLTSYQPKTVYDLRSLSHLSNLTWADPDPTSADSIQILIGADLYSEIILPGVRKGLSGQPIAQNSVFGWIISGPLTATQANNPTVTHITVHHCTSLSALSKSITRFWETEDIPPTQALTPDEERCEQHFLATHSRDATGKYVVRLPFKTEAPIIGQSRRVAGRQFMTLFRRLHSNPALKSEYSLFMNEYEDLGHMSRAPDLKEPSQISVYIPHHPVFRADSLTTRLKVVFNASSLTSNGTSLNDHLLAGPKLQADLPAILLKWRQFRYVYTADIAKMYRQILVDPRDVDFQRILWQPESSQVPQSFRLLTVTYGMTCAPFLALRVLRRLTEDEGSHYPLAVPVLLNHAYVDDLLFGGHDIAELRHIRNQLIGLLRCGGFQLRKWASNHSLLTDIDPADHGLACSKSLAPDESVKVLGIA